MIQVLALFMALGVIVYLVKKRYALYQAMLVGIIILIVSMGKPPATVFALLGEALSKWTTIELVLAVGLFPIKIPLAQLTGDDIYRSEFPYPVKERLGFIFKKRQIHI